MALSKLPVVIVTGASKGMGLSTVSLLLRGSSSLQPANVVTVSRSISEGLTELQHEFGNESGNANTPRLECVQGDVADEATNEEAVKKAQTLFGRVDGVVLNAGMLEMQRLSETTTADFAKHMSVNVTSLVTTLHYALPLLRQSPTGTGKVVFVSSGAAVGNIAGWGAYNASKAAMNAIARTLANEEKKIACWAVRPGRVDTEMMASIRSGGNSHMDADVHAKFHKEHADGALVRPEQPAHVFATLATKGTRDSPSNKEGGLGAQGAFVNWDAEELAEFRARQ